MLSQPVNPATRIQNAIKNVNDPTPCTKCGGLFFYKVPCYMFSSGGVTFRVVSVSPQELIVCVCGEPQLPGNFGQGAPKGSERDLFVNSIKAAQEYRSKTKVPNLADLTSQMAAKDELDALRTRLDDLTEALSNGGQIEIVEASTEEPQTFEGDPEVPETKTPAPAPAEDDGLKRRPTLASDPSGAIPSMTRQAPKGARTGLKRQGGQ